MACLGSPNNSGCRHLLRCYYRHRRAREICRHKTPEMRENRLDVLMSYSLPPAAKFSRQVGHDLRFAAEEPAHDRMQSFRCSVGGFYETDTHRVELWACRQAGATFKHGQECKHTHAHTRTHAHTHTHTNIYLQGTTLRRVAADSIALQYNTYYHIDLRDMTHRIAIRSNTSPENNAAQRSDTRNRRLHPVTLTIAYSNN